MSLRPNTRRTVASLLGTITGWIVAIYLAIWVIAATPHDADHIVESVLAGICAGIATYIVDHAPVLRAAGRRLSTPATVLLRTGMYTALIIAFTCVAVIIRAPLVLGISPLALSHDAGFLEFVFGGQFLTLLVLLLLASFGISFVREIHRMFGPGLFTKLVLGTYHRPIEEERIIMFLDLNNSTQLAEKLGPLRFAEFKNDFFHDLAEPVLATRGEVFQYVGDEVVLTWELSKGLPDARWLRFFFLFAEVVTKHASRYLKTYGSVPTFKAGVHAGTVVTTEVGDLKKNIVHSGDAMNTAARIEAECRHSGKAFLVSDELLRQTIVPSGYTATGLGEHELRGRSEPVTLWSVEAEKQMGDGWGRQLRMKNEE